MSNYTDLDRALDILEYGARDCVEDSNLSCLHFNDEQMYRAYARAERMYGEYRLALGDVFKEAQRMVNDDE